MATYTTLKQAIQQVIKTNGNNEITGAILQQSLLAMINSLGGYFQFVGVANPSTNPGTPDQNVYYLATEPGTYANFGGVVVNANEACFLFWNGAWTKIVSGLLSTNAAFAFKRTLEATENVFSDNLPIGIYSVRPTNAGVPDGYNEWGWLIVFADSLRFIINSSGNFWIKTSPNGWEVPLKTAFNEIKSSAFAFKRTLEATENVFSDNLPIGIYSVRPTNAGVPDGYNEWGWLIVFADSLRFIINSSGSFWIKTSPNGWEIPMKNEFADLRDRQKEIVSIFGSLTGSELQPDETMTGYLLIANTGLPYAISSVPDYKLKKYTVSPGDIIKISANANYNNYLFSILDADGNKIDGKQSNAGATYTKTENAIVIPDGGVILYVAYNSTVFDGSAFTDLQQDIAQNTLFGKKWACVGDSLTEVNARTTKHYFDYVAEETGVIPVNYGVSGTGYARRRDENIAFYQRISGIDVNCDIVTIFGSFNDLGAISADFPLGNVDDSGIISIAGCINQTLDNLFAIKPIVRLGIIAPTPWDTTQPGNGQNADHYVDLLKAICDRRSIPFLDLYHHSNLRPWDATFRQLAYSKDGGSGTHPDETGHSLIAPMFRSFIESLI